MAILHNYPSPLSTTSRPMEIDELKLWCYIEGMRDRDYFSVSIPITQSINDLNKKIYNLNKQEKSFTGFDARDLILTKVRYIMIFM